jgi:hypothetical protein
MDLLWNTHLSKVVSFIGVLQQPLTLMGPMVYNYIFKSGLNISDKTKGKSKVYYISIVGKDPNNLRMSLSRIGLHLTVRLPVFIQNISRD